ncbi:hypothetical protein BDY19DRAFT_771843 [Irpex rosettiformis]|uniref:Uncharacterized protein n=1 Tax=Irpex rosettiformis TaxID=378272 RepID=A0ACB8U7S0_9APHY|nr:hypothetical protein BDY19DRAFT_771843 [Irpex rosettiformis]
MEDEHGDIDRALLVRLDLVTLAVIVLALYHHLITVHEEVRFVWFQKFSGATVIYLANRYVVLTSIVLLTIFTFVHSEAANVCKAGVPLAAALLQSAQLIQGIFATLRTYAIRDSSILPSVTVFTLYTAAFITRIIWIISSTVAPGPGYKGCLTYYEQRYFKSSFLSLRSPLSYILTR